MTATTYDGVGAVPYPRSAAARADAPVSRPRRQRASSVWREEVKTRVAELRAELNNLEAAQKHDPRAEAAWTWLKEAEQFVIGGRGLLGTPRFGRDVEAAQQKIHAAEVALIQVSPLNSVKAKLSRIVPYGEQLLPEGDSCLTDLRALADRRKLNEDDRDSIAEDVRAVFEACRAQHRRVRNFRNLLLGAALALVILAAVVGIVCAMNPSAIFLGANTAMAKSDVFAIELLGLLSASLVGAVAIRQIRGTSTPYGVPMASLLLKLPTGALTAVAGLLLIRSGVVGPEFATTHSGHLAAYALGLGASQQSFTRLIDRQAQNVLNHVATVDRDAARDSE